jgi:hypothetical protein
MEKNEFDAEGNVHPSPSTYDEDIKQKLSSTDQLKQINMLHEKGKSSLTISNVIFIDLLSYA